MSCIHKIYNHIQYKQTHTQTQAQLFIHQSHILYRIYKSV